MNKHYWTGIGSRHMISELNKARQQDIGLTLAKKGWTLLTGGAAGSDFNFLQGAGDVDLPKNQAVKLITIIRPEDYKQYKGRNHYPCTIEYMQIDDFKRAKDYYFHHEIFTEKQFNNMPKVAQHLHARNFYQIMDENGIVRSEFVAYAAKEDRWGNISGGTRTAVSIARIEKIPVFNIKLKGQYEALQDFMKGLPNVE